MIYLNKDHNIKDKYEDSDWIKTPLVIFLNNTYDLLIKKEVMKEYGFEEMRGTEDRHMPARHSFADFLQITVDDDNGVVHNHSQRHNQGSQCDGVQLNAKGIEKPQ